MTNPNNMQSEVSIPPIQSSAELLAESEDPALLPPFEGADDLMLELDCDEIPKPAEIIKGILHQGLKAYIGGPSKARKTWTLLDLCVSMATGRDWWKFPTQQGQVLYINFEITRYFMAERVKSVCKAKGVEDTAGNLTIWNLRGKKADFIHLLPALKKQMEIGGFQLIVIDPVYKGLSGERDENSARDVGALCFELERIAVETGAAVIYAAHFSKGNQSTKSSLDRVSGSGVWSRDADTIITMSAHKERDCYTVEMILRNLPEQLPFVIEWQHPTMRLRPDLDPLDLEQPKRPGSKAGASGFRMPESAAVLAHLPTLAMADGSPEKACMEAVVLMTKLGIHKNHHAAVRAHLLHDGVIKEIRFSKRHKIMVCRPEVMTEWDKRCEQEATKPELSSVPKRKRNSRKVIQE